MRNAVVCGPHPRRAAALVTGLLIAAIYVGSGGLAHFDAALAGYCGATLVACYATAYQVAAFWQRRPSAFYGRALLRAVRRPRQLARVLRTAGRDLAAQRVIVRRGRLRWLAHMSLAWGTLLGFAVTLPLVWGWLHFELAGDHVYRVVFAELPLGRFATDGAVGWLIFHALHLAAVAVVLGATYFVAVRVRLRRQPGLTARFHLAPVLLLLAIALTGLALPVAASLGPPWFRIAALIHEAAVITLLVALPYGKLIHLFIRPLHLGAQLVRATSMQSAVCRNCEAPLAPAVQLRDVELMLAEQGFRFDGHQQLCPVCRRRQLATVHSQLLGAQFQPQPAMRRAAFKQAA
jgi:hypothetical protein